MKTKYVILTSLMICLVAFSNLNAQNKNKQTNVNDTVTFKVSMHCEVCKSKIENNISWEKGVKDMEVNLQKKTVKVVYDKSKTNKASLQKSIEKLGYSCDEKKR